MRYPMRNDLIVLLLATLVSYPVGLWLRQPWLLPVLNALPAYVVLVHRLRKGERGGAVRAMLWWAAALALVGTIAFVWWPEPIGKLVLNGPAHKSEMFTWIRTGRGAEGSIRLFLPEHLVKLGAFIVVGLGTGSAGALLMGAALTLAQAVDEDDVGGQGVQDRQQPRLAEPEADGVRHQRGEEEHDQVVSHGVSHRSCSDGSDHYRRRGGSAFHWA